jgi:hypothetical protein
MPQSPYIDGTRIRQQRAIKLDPTNANAHISYVALEDSFTSSNRIRTFAPTLEIEGQAVPSAGVATIDIDCRGYQFCFIRIESTTAAFTECLLDVSSKHGSEKWETVANGDYFYTTGTGEAEGNSIKLIRRVKNNGTANQSNPRILVANNSTWLLLFVVGTPQMRFRISTLGSVNFLYTLTQ